MSYLEVHFVKCTTKVEVHFKTKVQFTRNLKCTLSMPFLEVHFVECTFFFFFSKVHFTKVQFITLAL